MSEHAPIPKRRRSASTVLLVAVALALGACTEDRDVLGESTSGPVGSSDEITATEVDASLETLDQIVTTAMETTGVPGVAVAVVHDDEVVLEQGYGVRDTGSSQPVTPETVFQLASMSKPISSTIMAGLVGDEVFAWDDPIARYAAELRLSDDWVAEHVTFADAFSHRTGLPGSAAGNDLEAIGFDRDAILDRLDVVPLDDFRTTYSYSNFGMTLGGEAAARAAGSTWDEVAQTVLFEPAGMASTSMRRDDYAAQENKAALHVEHDGGWSPDFERFPDPQAPAGGVSSNVVDLGRWMRLQLAGGSLDGEQIIDEDALDTTHTPQIMKTPPQPTVASPSGFYGLGWNIATDTTGAVRWDHSGAFSVGASTTVKMIPEDGLGIVVLTNGEPIGVPEAITDAYLEYLQTGETDMEALLELWGERFGGIYGEPLVDLGNRPVDPEPALANAVYVGTYGNDYVGEVEIVAGPDGLELLAGPEPMRFPLEHWQGDTFIYADAPELPEIPAEVTFDVVDGATATAVDISALSAAGTGPLLRR